MEKSEDARPPQLPLMFFRWFCCPDYREEIEGDLLEQFYLNAEKLGEAKARRLFTRDVLRLFRPEIVVNFHLFKTHFSDMKTENWLKLLASNLLFMLFIIAPFLPGPSNKLSMGLSALGQFAGFFGLILIPIGLVWAVFEFKKRSSAYRVFNGWNSGYYFAVAATFLSVLIYGLLTMGLFMEEGWWVVGVSALLLCSVLWAVVPGIAKLRRRTSHTFNPAPLYLLSIPVFALATRLFLLEPVVEYGRNAAIEQSQPLITAIENYHAKEGHYPDALADLQASFLPDLPKPKVMGIRTFIYEKTPDAYNLAFVQYFGATQEVVMYNKNNRHNVKGYYASSAAGAANWRYFWLD